MQTGEILIRKFAKPWFSCIFKRNGMYALKNTAMKKNEKKFLTFYKQMHPMLPK
jgi:hypothetical protein